MNKIIETKYCWNIVKILFLFLFFYASGIYAQGTIKGSVIDSLSLDKLKGTEVILAGTNLSAVANTDGEFYISGIPEGEYILRISYLGYKEKKILVAIKSEETFSRNIELVPDIKNGNEAGLTNQVKSQDEEINLQLRSNTITNVIAGKKLQRLPDENITVALSRLPGVSIAYHSLSPLYKSVGGQASGNENSIIILFPPQDDFPVINDPGSGVSIRGLGLKYSNITINGIRIPSTSANDKNIDLDIIPGRSFEKIEISKTITSDEDADATAGAVKTATGKAPGKRTVRAEMLGNYNRFDKSANQYNFNLSYGERFFDKLLGVKVNADIEKKILSNEYRNNINFYNASYFSYTNAERRGLSSNILLDLNTPDGGSLKFNNFFNKASTGYYEYSIDSTVHIDPRFVFSDREAEQTIFISSIAGCNHIFNFDIDWNLAFSESKNDHPYYYSLNFRKLFYSLEDEYNLEYTKDSPAKNYFRDKSASINISKQYNISSEITGRLKFGGKFRINSRSYDEDLRIENSSVSGDNQYRKLADGAVIIKDFTGTRFDGLVGKSKTNILLSYFQDYPPGKRTLFDEYTISLINMDALRLWRKLTFNDFYSNDGPGINSYNISGNISAGYVMHNLNFGQWAKFITGLRIENEKNEYAAFYFPNAVHSMVELNNDIPIRTNSYHFNKATILPNFQMILQPTDFLNLRLAAYKTLIRPDYNARLPKIFYAASYLNMGNPDLKNADVWNYEFQTQFYGNDIGLLGINAFYKDIKGMQQATNGVTMAGTEIIESLGIDLSSYPVSFPFTKGGPFSLYTYFNSSKPTRIWGFEIEHKANFRYLPGLLKNITLNYNLTFLRSETWAVDVIPVYAETMEYKLSGHKEKLGSIPQFFTNVILGYGIKGFSFRISYYYQDGYRLDNYLSPVDENKLSRLDIAVRQQIFKNISIIFSLNNITNSKEEYLYENGYSYGKRVLTAQAYRYGFNFDFGIGFDL